MLTIPMIILMFLELAHLVIIGFAAALFCDGYKKTHKTLFLIVLLYCFMSSLGSFGGILSQIFFNVGNNFWAGQVYKLVLISIASDIFVGWLLTVEMFELERLKWTRSLTFVAWMWLAYRVIVSPFHLTFSGDLVQPLVTKELISLYFPIVFLVMIQWLIFAGLAIAESLKPESTKAVSRSYSNLLYIASCNILISIFSSAYAYFNISWMYILSWVFALVWSLAFFLSLAVFKNEDITLIVNPFRMLQRHLVYKLSLPAFLAVFTLTMLLSASIGQSLSFGFTQRLSALGIPREVIISQISINQNLIVSIGLGGAVLLTLIFFGAIRAEIRPFEKMAKSLQTMQPGTLSALVEDYGEGEAGELARAFNGMVLKVRDQADELLRKNVSLVESKTVVEKRNEVLREINEVLMGREKELEEFEDAAVRRELYMVELKRQIKGLNKRSEI